MIDLVKSICDFFISRSNSWGFKTVFIICLLASMLFFDYLMKISYNAYLQNKLNNLETMVRLKEAYAGDTINYHNLRMLEAKIFNKSHYTDILDEFIYGKGDYVVNDFKLIDVHSKLDSSSVDTSFMKYIDDFLSSDSISNAVHFDDSDIIITTLQRDPRNMFWMFVTSNVFVVFALLPLLILPFTDRKSHGLNIIASMVAIGVMLIVWGTIVTWVAYKIPVLCETGTCNYVLNVVIHLLFFGVLAYWSDKSNTKEKDSCPR